MRDHGVMTNAPWVEWHGERPFAFARLDPGYTAELEALAHQYLPEVLALPVGTLGPALLEASPSGARYASYNVFLLDGAFLPLFTAIRRTYRALLKAIDAAPTDRFIRCWYNLQHTGAGLPRHHHHAAFVGTFAARAEGTVTRFGPSPEPTGDDFEVVNLDGQLLVTTGMGHFHDVSASGDLEYTRVTYAFDIFSADQWRNDRVQIPFDSAPD